MQNAIDFFELVRERRTVFEFSDEAVKESDLKKILEAGRWAPSSHNSQPWSFVVVRDSKRIETLMKLCHYGFFHTDPAALIVAVKEPAYENQKALLRSSLKEVTDTHQYLNLAMPVLIMHFAAFSLGLGSCILSPVGSDANRLLHIPKGREAVLFLGLGHEKKNSYQKPAERKPLDETVFSEQYGEKNRA